MKQVKPLLSTLVLIFSILFSSCLTFKNGRFEESIPVPQKLSIILAGDIMAHQPNWSHGNYDGIYDAIRDDISSADLSFANFETPVSSSNEYSTYPHFNVHEEYAMAAVNAGFNVFSLANNHSIDQKLVGIKETESFFANLMEETKDSDRPVFASGLKKTADEDLNYCIIEYGEWKILYVAITEILNEWIYIDYINFIQQRESHRNKFIEKIKALKEESQCDAFILSIHTGEEEYVRTVTPASKAYFKKLLDNGVDIVWVNHVHVPREWEIYEYEETGTSKAIFYGNGNTISAQRYNPNYSDPSATREWTGDGYFNTLELSKKDGGIKIEKCDTTFITTYVDTTGFCSIKKLNNDFITELKNLGTSYATKWATYLEKRKALVETIKGNYIWQ